MQIKKTRKAIKLTKPKGIDFKTFDFDVEFEKGLTSDEFKNKMHKRIEFYPWKNNIKYS